MLAVRRDGLILCHSAVEMARTQVAAGANDFVFYNAMMTI